jgi:hypothetical protein
MFATNVVVECLPTWLIGRNTRVQTVAVSPSQYSERNKQKLRVMKRWHQYSIFMKRRSGHTLILLNKGDHAGISQLVFSRKRTWQKKSNMNSL